MSLDLVYGFFVASSNGPREMAMLTETGQFLNRRPLNRADFEVFLDAELKEPTPRSRRPMNLYSYELAGQSRLHKRQSMKAV